MGCASSQPHVYKNYSEPTIVIGNTSNEEKSWIIGFVCKNTKRLPDMITENLKPSLIALLRKSRLETSVVYHIEYPLDHIITIKEADNLIKRLTEPRIISTVAYSYDAIITERVIDQIRLDKHVMLNGMALTFKFMKRPRNN